MTSVRPSATLYREGPELDDLLAELDEQHPGQVRVVDVTYGREGGVLGFFAKRRVGVRYALDADDALEHAETDIDTGIDTAPDPDEAPAASGRHHASPLDDLLSAAEAAEAEAMVTRGVAPSTADEPGEPNVEFARVLLDLALAKAAQRRASEDAARAAFVESGTRVLPVTLPVTEPDTEPDTEPVTETVTEPVTETVTTPISERPVVLPVVLPAVPPPPAGSPRMTAPTPPAPAPAPATGIWTAPPPKPAPRRVVRPRPEPAQSQQSPLSPQPAAARPSVADLLRSTRTRPVGAHRAAPAVGARTEFTLRRELAELGVPVSWIPDGAADAYWAIEQLCTRVPAAPTPDLAPGSVLVVAGPGEAARALAAQLCNAHRLAPSALVIADSAIAQRWQARELAGATRAARRDPVVVAVDTGDTAWAAGIIGELVPDTLWTVVDATRKPADLRRELAGLGRHSDALAVVNAASTASPASVWELDVPIALLDGRPATRGTWAALLIDGLAALED